MRQFFFDFFGYIVFFYSMGLIISYVVMMVLAARSIFKSKAMSLLDYDRDLIWSSPYTPGVSIVAPAFNEEQTIIDNVHSLLDQDYPLFEVVIVNDGSTDRTLEKMIENFSLVEVPYAYIERIHTRPFRRLFESTDERFKRLIVVDKENGGTKADAVNAGLNVAQYPYFINTDVDCILAKDAIFQCIKPVLRKKNVIAVSGVMTMSNGCEIENGRLKSRKAPRTLVPLFQELEYMRSFLVGKMAWSTINAVPNVSGGYGLFDREVIVSAGGYSPDSFAEDMDMLIRAIGYCCAFDRPYKVVQITNTCCWTEGPPTLSVLYRQRTRWARGLMQYFSQHWHVLFNRKYKRFGMITMPYILIFEFLAPIIEVSGLLVFIYLAFTGGVNWLGALIIFLAIYLFCMFLSMVVVFYDYVVGGTFDKVRSYFFVVIAAIFEPIMYHPFIVYFSLVGYAKYLFRTKSSWGKMTRKGYSGGDHSTEVKQLEVLVQPQLAAPL